MSRSGVRCYYKRISRTGLYSGKSGVGKTTVAAIFSILLDYFE